MATDRFERLMCQALAAHLDRVGRPDVPAGGELLWRWFVALSTARRWTVAGPEPIQFAEIDAYQRLTGWPIEERHVRILQAMDATFLRHQQPTATDRQVSARPMTAGLFDALFG